MRVPSSERLLRIAAACALIALALMTWGLYDPSVGTIMIWMTVGQALGTASFAALLFVIVRDIKRSRVLYDRESKAPEEPARDRDRDDRGEDEGEEDAPQKAEAEG